jgi:hypothetical protein
MKISTQMIASLLRQADIEGYIELGAPANEYDSEAEALAIAFSELSTEEITTENITAILIEAWRHSFNLSDSDLEMRKREIKIVAKAIVDGR